MRIKVGLTGNIGCGKSTVSKILGELGAEVCDADKMVHQYYSKGHQIYQEVVESFGQGILDSEGNIEHRALGEIVFLDSEKLKVLEDITHPQLRKDIDNMDYGLMVVEATLIFEKRFEGYFDKIVTVYVPKEISKLRTINRGSSEQDFNRRWKLQMPLEEKMARSDYVIDNSGRGRELYLRTREVFDDIARNG